MLRQEKGITLVALIVTIIILIILAGVSIASLTGEHGILTEAQTTRQLNSYNGAKEQINLAFSTIRSQIMIEAVKESSYDARKKDEINKFMDSLRVDLPADKGFTFSVTAATTGNPQEIFVKYVDASLKQGIIEKGATDADDKPKQNGVVYTKIIVNEQSVSYDFDIAEPDSSLTYSHDAKL